jgi:hypothetical protein
LVERNEVEDYLKDHSRFYPSVLSVKFLAKGGEAIVYRVEHGELDEIVAKCSYFESWATPEMIKASYDAMLYESQTLKLLKNYDSMTSIREEIIEINLEK